ncbi:MAG: hypothetical protein JJE15_05710 [Desulfobacteraceae bacterium]|nr:hypothetical protein [Desulfobacteraceae bacterium]
MKTKLTTLGIEGSTTRPTVVLCHNWGDTLVSRDPVKKEIVPCLAESYRLVGTNAIEFELRRGIKFHNGEPFNAHAVKFSVDLFKSPDSLTSKYFKKFKEVTVLDEHTVRIESSGSNRLDLEVIANMLIMYPPQYYKKAGKKRFGTHPIGTGPYQFVSWERPSEIVFKANPHYFGDPKGKAQIPELKIWSISEEMLRIEGLMTGQVDLIRSGSVSPEQLQFLEASPKIKIRKADIIRNYFIIMDALGRSGVDYFKDRRVRRALNHAINKDEIIKKVLKGCATINHSVTTPYHFGHEPDVLNYPYDPAKARKLLAEAGYPYGFSIDLYAARDESDTEAIARYLKAVGVKTNIKWMGGKWDILYKKLLAGKVPLAFINWGSYSVFDASAILDPYFMLDDPLCYGSTPQIDSLLRRAHKIGSQEKCKALYSKALRMIAQEAFWVPLYYGNSVAAMNKDLNFEPSYDEIDRYFTASWAK